MTTEQYDNELPRNYFLRVEGYNNKLLEERRFARVQTFFSFLPYATKGFSFNDMIKALPLPGDEPPKKQGKKVITNEMLQEIRKKHSGFNVVQNNKKRM